MWSIVLTGVVILTLGATNSPAGAEGGAGRPAFTAFDVDADGSVIDDGGELRFGDHVRGDGTALRRLGVTTNAAIAPEQLSFSIVGRDADHLDIRTELPKSPWSEPTIVVTMALDLSQPVGKLDAALVITHGSGAAAHDADDLLAEDPPQPLLINLAGAVFRRWDELGYSYGAQSARDAVADLLDSATTTTQRIALFGDSQETSPGGAGSGYVPRLNYELITAFTNGMTGESRSMYPGVYAGSHPPAAWLLRGRRRSVSNSSLLNDPQILPQFRVKQVVDHHGMSLVLQHNGGHVREGTFEDLDLPDDVDFIGHDQPLRLDVFCVGHEGSPALQWKYAPAADDEDPFEAPVVDSGTLSGLDGPLRIVRISTDVVTNPSPDTRPFSHMLVQSADPNAAVHMCGLRWRRAQDPGGIAVTPISDGGYRSFSYLRNHSEAGPMLDAAGPWQAVMFQFGTNDAGAELAPSTFRRNTLELIAALRSEAWLDDPELLVLLVSEYPRTGSDEELAILDAQPGVLASICDEDDRCVLLHARRFVDDVGWTHETAMTYLHDGTHPNALGARTMAQAVTDALRHAAGLLPDADVDGSGEVDMRDLAAVLTSLGRRAGPEGPRPEFDVNGDGIVDSRDVLVVLKRLR